MGKYIKDQIKGDTFNGFSVQLKRNNIVIPILGSQIIMHFKKNPSSTVPDFEFKTSDGSIEITDAINGVFVVKPKILDGDAGTYYYDIQITYSDGVIQTLFKDTFNLIQDVSR